MSSPFFGKYASTGSAGTGGYYDQDDDATPPTTPRAAPTVRPALLRGAAPQDAPDVAACRRSRATDGRPRAARAAASPRVTADGGGRARPDRADPGRRSTDRSRRPGARWTGDDAAVVRARALRGDLDRHRGGGRAFLAGHPLAGRRGLEGAGHRAVRPRRDGSRRRRGLRVARAARAASTAASSWWRAWRSWPGRRGTTIAGGDVVSGPALAVTVAVTGWADREDELVGRDGALGRRPGRGDRGAGRVRGRPAAARARRARARRARPAPPAPEPRLAEGRALARAGATAMIDLSDGLATDARHLAERSGVQLSAAGWPQVPCAPGRRAARARRPAATTTSCCSRSRAERRAAAEAAAPGQLAGGGRRGRRARPTRRGRAAGRGPQRLRTRREQPWRQRLSIAAATASASTTYSPRLTRAASALLPKCPVFGHRLNRTPPRSSHPGPAYEPGPKTGGPTCRLLLGRAPGSGRRAPPPRRARRASRSRSARWPGPRCGR